MNHEQRMVTEFYRAFSLPIGASPSIPDEATCALRMRLLQRECEALHTAFAQRDVTAVANALADLLYVSYGTAIACGLDMAPIFREVHRANMSNIGAHNLVDGTLIKSREYSPPCLGPILAALTQGNASATQACMSEVPGSVTAHVAMPDGRENSHVEPVVPRAPASSLSVADERVSPPDRTPSHTTADSLSSARALQDDPTPRHAHPSIRCPRCSKNFVRRSHRTGLQEWLQSLIYLYPFRCAVCGHRFRVFQFRVHHTGHVMNRRRYRRLPVHIPTTFVGNEHLGGQHVGQGTLLEISSGGCYLQTSSRLPEGTVLSLALQTTPAAQAVRVETAIVRSVRARGVGIAFLRLSESEQKRLTQYIQPLLDAQPEPAPEDEKR